MLDLLGHVFFVGGFAAEAAAREDAAVFIGFVFFFFGEASFGGNVGVVIASTALCRLIPSVVDVCVAVLIEWLRP